MVDARFAAPPEDFEELQPKLADNKGKGKSKEKGLLKKRKRVEQEDNEEAGNTEEPDLYDEVLNGPLPSTSKSVGEGGADDQDAEDDDEQDGIDDNDINKPLNLLPKPLQLDNLEKYNSKVDKTGIIYLSRIPPGMGPSKVKHILSSYGETGRIYLVAADPSSNKPSSSNNKTSTRIKHRPHRFIEGWIEFSDKTVARHTAELLNARPIGDVAMSRNSKKNGGTKKWKDDVWTMRYLPRFKWNMLSEQVAIEAATRAALLRNELAQSKKEQAEYLRQVERAKNYDKAQDKKRVRLERKGGETAAAAKDKDDEKKTTKKGRTFEQREGVDKRGKGVDERLGQVLDSLF